MLPSRVQSIVLVSKLHLPTMRALAYARATRPDYLEAVTVNVDPEETADLAREWEDRQIPVALKVIDSPYREITKPVLDYVRRTRKDAPRDIVTVFIPEYVVGHWWEHLLHNQSALRLKGRLLFTPGVMVTSVPWQLSSSEALDARIRERAERVIGARSVPRIRSAAGRHLRRSRLRPRRVGRRLITPADLPAPPPSATVASTAAESTAAESTAADPGALPVSSTTVSVGSAGRLSADDLAPGLEVEVDVGAGRARRSLRGPVRRPGDLRPARVAR